MGAQSVASLKAAAARSITVNEPSRLQAGGRCGGIKRARCALSHPARRGPHSDFHAGRYARRRSRPKPGGSAGERRPGAARQYVSPVAAAGCRDLREIRRHPRLHELAAVGAHRLGRISNLLAAGQPHPARGVRRVHQLRRSTHRSSESGAQYRHPESDRGRHHDGARPLRARDGRAEHRPRRDGVDASLGAPLPRRARRFSASLVRHRARSGL